MPATEMTRRALVVWDEAAGGAAESVATLVEAMLESDGVVVEVERRLDCLENADLLGTFDLIVPVATDAPVAHDLVVNISEAVARGTGLAICHPQASRGLDGDPLWRFIAGGQRVTSPTRDEIDFRVEIVDGDHPVTEGIEDFELRAEHVYLHVDPALDVLATTEFPLFHWYHSANGHVDMPIVWAKRWGLGRVYCNALGLDPEAGEDDPNQQLVRRGLIWASRGRSAALENGERFEDYFVEGKQD